MDKNDITVFYTCQKCGSILTEGVVLLPNGDKTKLYACPNCGIKHYADTEKSVFRTLKKGLKDV